NVECTSPSVKKTYTSDKDLLTNHKPEPHVRRRPSESTTVATPLNIYRLLSASVSRRLDISLACHWNAERQWIG
uniref:Uncharacterized protein n=1 Tax=Mesocestoides corti TaxID=53468 RepID=A0A5K3FH11_MESCO